MQTVFDERSKNRIASAVRTVENAQIDAANRRPVRRISPQQKSSDVAGYKIVSGGNGVYTANKVDPKTGELSAETYNIIATRATAYDLTAGDYVVGFVMSVTTLGG